MRNSRSKKPFTTSWRQNSGAASPVLPVVGLVTSSGGLAPCDASFVGRRTEPCRALAKVTEGAAMSCIDTTATVRTRNKQRKADERLCLTVEATAAALVDASAIDAGNKPA